MLFSLIACGGGKSANTSSPTVAEKQDTAKKEDAAKKEDTAAKQDAAKKKEDLVIVTDQDMIWFSMCFGRECS